MPRLPKLARGQVKRSAPMKRSPMPRGKDRGVPPKVRAQVRQRSKGWCEVGSPDAPCGPTWKGEYSCEITQFSRTATDLHHLVKRPRLHEPYALVHLCRRHHELCEESYSRGRLVFATDALFMLPLVHSDAPPKALWWRIERRDRKGGPLLQVLAEGRIQL